MPDLLEANKIVFENLRMKHLLSMQLSQVEIDWLFDEIERLQPSQKLAPVISIVKNE